MSDFLHIVCLDAPAPPNYGGAIDMYYKILALAATGRKIILHYFNYQPQRGVQELEAVCTAIYTYKRKATFQSLPIFQPYIVQSRVDGALINRLNGDDYPILLEGLHCSGVLPFLKNKQRVVLRMHNEEAAYYQHLAKPENSILKRLYFLQESKLLKRFQQKMDKQVALACLSEADVEIFERDYGFEKIDFIPCFVPWQELNIEKGKGDYCLYHGNLSVSENAEAASWLIQNIFSRLTVPLIIAGKGVPKKVLLEAEKYDHITCINNPTIAGIDELVRNAHVHVLPSMNATGVKLKLVNALLNGRFCITNHNGVKGSGLTKFVTEANSIAEWQQHITTAMQTAFSQDIMEERKEILTLYNNRLNAEKLNALWKHCQ